MIKDASLQEVESSMSASKKAFIQYAHSSLKERAVLLRTIAIELEALGDEVIRQAMEETNLPEARLKGERARTIFQLNSYAAACERGEWLEVSIDTANAERVPPKPDVRKTKLPLGPVLVFGSSNFPFAYSTAGGDTASALAAGCTVVVKAHPAHPLTSNMVADAVKKALKKLAMDENIFIHLHGASNSIGESLVKHPAIKAVGFTGSFQGGMALFHLANQRPEPIPVFAEMGSVNPVFLFNEKLSDHTDSIAQQCAESITLGVGQFCTNPGIIVGIKSPAFSRFMEVLASKISAMVAGKMLHTGIAKAYNDKSKRALGQQEVELVASTNEERDSLSGSPMVATVEATHFLTNPLLMEEVFGPFSMLVQCEDIAQVKSVADALPGQLTSTLIATDQEITANKELVNLISSKCGRLILNGVPTGVEVGLAMQHGGPFPATTDSRFTSVGADAIKRFARPFSYQNFSDSLLPDELKNSNPLNIWRTINDVLTKDKI